MLASFWAGVSGKLTDKAPPALALAFSYWLIGAGLWLRAHGGTAFMSSELNQWFSAKPVTSQALTTVAVVALIAVSATIVRRLTFPLLRLLTGSWRWPLAVVRPTLVSRWKSRSEEREKEIQAVFGKIDTGGATGEDLARLAAHERAIRRRPLRVDQRLPFRLGDLLLSTQNRITDKYGMDAVVCFPRMWLVLPESTRAEVQQSYEGLLTALSAMIWSSALLIFTMWTWWAAPAALVTAVVVYYSWLLNRLGLFADLLETSFDMHRSKLYVALRWPLPGNPAQEYEAGRELTRYLWRGSRGAEPSFASRTGGEDDNDLTSPDSGQRGPRTRYRGSRVTGRLPGRQERPRRANGGS